ncbi:MAG TPA: hypothetical protein VNI54_11475 [Thermoanaerobaculia bacterium]|nr:hypothetical protein [Thermoanaerobaculia bacterium]
MRKLIAATTLTFVLAGTAAALPRERERTPRERDNPIVRILKIVKRVFTPSTNELPVPPLPQQ